MNLYLTLFLNILFWPNLLNYSLLKNIPNNLYFLIIKIDKNNTKYCSIYGLRIKINCYY